MKHYNRYFNVIIVLYANVDQSADHLAGEWHYLIIDMNMIKIWGTPILIAMLYPATEMNQKLIYCTFNK